MVYLEVKVSCYSYFFFSRNITQLVQHAVHSAALDLLTLIVNTAVALSTETPARLTVPQLRIDIQGDDGLLAGTRHIQ